MVRFCLRVVIGAPRMTLAAWYWMFSSAVRPVWRDVGGLIRESLSSRWCQMRERKGAE